MSADTTPVVGAPLQFDRAIPVAPDAAEAAGPVVTCTSCRTAVHTEYYTVQGEQLCAECRTVAARQLAPVREWPLVLRATIFGLGAAVAGAVVYYGVIAITEFEIGLVAIVIGYMVGWAVRRGARGRGGRRLQIAAVALTYLSVAMAYLPLAMRGAAEGGASGAPSGATADSAGRSGAVSAGRSGAVADSAAAGRSPAAAVADGATAGDVTFGGALLALGMLAAFALALPVMAVVGSLPSGLISALIIGFGMQQAWKMTGAPALTIHGPYRVGGAPAPDAAASPPRGVVPA